MTFCKYSLAFLIILLLASCGAPDAATETGSNPGTSTELLPVSNTQVIFEREPMVSVLFQPTDWPVTGHQVNIEYYYWDKFHPLREATIRGNEPLLLPLTDNYSVGLYRIISKEIPSARPLYFVVNGEDDRIEISADLKGFLNGVAQIKPDAEMFVDAEIRNLFAQKMMLEDSIKDRIGEVTIIDPKYYTKKDALREDMELNSLKMYQALALLQQEFPETYFSKVVINLLNKPSRYQTQMLKDSFETEAAMLNRYYFAGIDINDEAWLGHPIFFQTVNEYITQYAGETPDEWVHSVNHIMQHISSPAIKRTVADFLVFYYLDRQYEEVARELAFTYIEGCTDDYFASLLQSDRYRSGPQANSKIPEFSMNDLAGNTQSISQLVGQGRVTLLYFWKSDCSFCKEEHEVIKRLQQLYADEGLNIVGVSLDTDAAKWQQTVKEYQLNWTNLSDLQGTTSKNIYDYAIRATPAVFIVRPDGTLLAKGLKGQQLQDFFKKYFNASNTTP